MAGVIGADKFSYDVWGETVNLASRLESHGLPGEIQVSDAVREALGDSFVFEPRGAIEVKGVGRLETWLLKKESDRRPATPLPHQLSLRALVETRGVARHGARQRRRLPRRPQLPMSGIDPRLGSDGSQSPPLQSPLSSPAVETDPHRARHSARRRRPCGISSCARLLDDSARAPGALGRSPHRAALAPPAHHLVAPQEGRGGRDSSCDPTVAQASKKDATLGRDRRP